MSDESEATVRIAKLIAARGLCSRREAERWIEEGRVTVHGEPARVDDGVDPTGEGVRVDGRPLPDAPPKAYYLLYKPKGYVTTLSDPEGRKTVGELIERLPHRVAPVGRLDVDTEGALLLTNDGDLAHRLTHPSMKVPKRYLVKVYRTPTSAKLDAIREGKVHLEDGPVAPAKVRVVDATDKENAWVEITITEGRNRLVRRLFQQLHHPVSKLRRESFATLAIRGMERGQVRALTGEEIARLRDIAHGVSPKKAGRGKPKGHARAKPDLGRPQARKRRLAMQKKKLAKKRVG